MIGNSSLQGWGHSTCFLAWLHRPTTDCTCKGGQQRSYDQKGRNDWQHRASSKELME